VKELAVRKHPRMKGYNYSRNGAYFITFCVKYRHEILGKIVGRGIPDALHSIIPDAPESVTTDAPLCDDLGAPGILKSHGFIIAPYAELTEYGNNVIKAIHFLNNKSQVVYIDKYVVMPNHVHMIVLIQDEFDGMANGASGTIDYGAPGVIGHGAFGPTDHGASGMPRPTNSCIPKHISSIKRFTNKQAGFDMWQTSYHDHIIRDEEDYLNHWRYIDENPARWDEDEYNSKYILSGSAQK